MILKYYCIVGDHENTLITKGFGLHKNKTKRREKGIICYLSGTSFLFFQIE